MSTNTHGSTSIFSFFINAKKEREELKLNGKRWGYEGKGMVREGEWWVVEEIEYATYKHYKQTEGQIKGETDTNTYEWLFT